MSAPGERGVQSNYINWNRYSHYTRVAAYPQERKENITNAKYTYLTRRVGSTTYKVRVYFNEAGQETMEDKIIRLIRNDALDSKAECGIMELPQMSRQPERSAT